MTTHPTSLNAGSGDGERTVSAAGHVPDLRGRISEQRVAMTVDDLAALISAERHRHKLEKSNEASPISTIAG
jgi:hypothetical protein